MVSHPCAKFVSYFFRASRDKELIDTNMPTPPLAGTVLYYIGCTNTG